MELNLKTQQNKLISLGDYIQLYTIYIKQKSDND